MKILHRLMTALRLRKADAPTTAKPARRERPVTHQNSREIDRRLRQERARNARKNC